MGFFTVVGVIATVVVVIGIAFVIYQLNKMAG